MMNFRKHRFSAAVLAAVLIFSCWSGTASASETAEDSPVWEERQEEAAAEAVGEEEQIQKDQPAAGEEEAVNPDFSSGRNENGVYGEYGTYSISDFSLLINMYNAEDLGYADVPETSGWRYEAIRYVKNKGIMNGISGTDLFMPDEKMTRAMFAAVIYRLAGSPSAAYEEVFPDVPSGNYYSIPVVWANKAGIIRGHSNTGLFGTFEEVAREDIVTMLYRYARNKGYDSSARALLSGFPDASSVSGYAVEAMQWAVENRIIEGRSTTKELDPRGSATRVECAAIISRFCAKFIDSQAPSDDNTDYYAIMGKSTVTIDQMVKYYNAKTSYPDFYEGTEAETIEDFCRIYYAEAAAEGVRAEVAFCQAMKETNFLRYGGDVGIEQFNFAGLGATGNGERGLYFDTPRIGIRAQIQHLKAYASELDLDQECVDPRFSYVSRGCAPYVEWLGIQENPYGKGWATSPGYGNDIVKRISVLKSY